MTTSKTLQTMVSEARAQIRQIDSSALRQRSLSSYYIIDVREPDEYSQGHLPGAINLPRGVLEFRLSTVPQLAEKSTPILLYCQSGGRSSLAGVALQQLGYQQVSSLSDGYAGWIGSD